MSRPAQPVRLWCNHCMQQTWHEQIATHTRHLQEEVEYDDGTKRDYPLVTVITADVFACRGCDEVTVRRTEVCAERDDESVEFVPPRQPRRQPTWLWQGVPATVRRLLREVYAAIQSGSLQLAGMGTRALLDLLMDDTVGNPGTFTARVEGMVAAGHLSVKQKDGLPAALDFGHAAAHRGYRPKLWDLMAALDVVEFLLHSHYVQPRVADRLKKNVPPRPKTTTA